MKRITDSFVDERLRWPDDACVHCGRDLDAANITQEHILSKCLLTKPYPEELMTLAACRECNVSYSRDEEYFAALLNAVLAGSTDPEKQTTEVAARMFERRTGLQAKIEEARTETNTLFGENEIRFTPEQERVDRVVVKNARGHAVYELDRWMTADPDRVVAVPLQSLTNEQYQEFEAVQSVISGWSEIGTRMFQRECFACDPHQTDFSGPWIVVQDSVYRYAVVDDGEGLLVRSVVREYLATEVYWSND